MSVIEAHGLTKVFKTYRKEQAKEAIEKLLERLNGGEALSSLDFARELKAFIPS